MINKSNYEAFLIDYLHNELSAEETNAVLQFLQENPEVEEEFVLLQQTLLTPDETITFDYKETLYKEEKPALKAVIPMKKYLAIAAMFSGVVLALFFLLPKSEPEINVAQHTQTNDAEPLSKPDIRVEEKQQRLQQTPVQQLASVETKKETNRYKQGSDVKRKTPSSHEPDQEVPVVVNTMETPKHQVIEAPKNQESNQPSINQPRETPIVIAQEPLPATNSDPTHAEEPLVANNSKAVHAIELNQKKQPVLFKAINKLLALKHSLKETKKTLEQTEVTVMVGNKVLFNINH